MASLTLKNVKKALGGNQILQGIDLNVSDGELVVLVGPSGCGKSTLLRTIAGLEIADSGSLHIGDKDVTKLAPKDRDVAMVFQSYALYPHLTVRKNLSFGLELHKTAPKLIRERIRVVSTMLGLEPLLDRLPKQLSGGQRQRVAMGRAIARRPTLFLFDEPLSNLDAALRAEVRVEIKHLHAELGATMIYVTHDQVEAMTLADQLVVLNGGSVEQFGPPLEVYEHPASRFVAAFMGSPSMNFLSAKFADGRVSAPDVSVEFDGTVERDDVVLGVRPQDLSRTSEEDANITLKIDVLEPMGFEAYAHGTVGEQRFVARLDGDSVRGLRTGDDLYLGIPEPKVHLFDPDTDRTICR